VKKLNPRNQIKGTMYLMLSLIFIQLITGEIPSQATSLEEGVSQDQATQLIREAAHATEEAWEEFHAAAIEGTLASPLIQVTIEGQLHEARGLLMQARIAKRSQDYQTVKDITQQIQEITQNIIQSSRERKQ
jgi:predicted Holliday junction resolvase-like endonuclease